MEELLTDTEHSPGAARRYHVYFSYNKADRERVREIIGRLGALDPGFRPFDEQEMIPGESEIGTRERALAESDSLAVLIGPSGLSPLAREEARQAVRGSIDRGLRAFLVYLPHADGRKYPPPGWLLDRTPVDLKRGFDEQGGLTWDGLVLLIAGVKGMAPRKARAWLEAREPRLSKLASPERLGRRGITALSDALEALTPPPRLPREWDRPALEDMHAVVSAMPAATTKQAARREQAISLITDLRRALEAASFLRSSMPQTLRTTHLRNALVGTLKYAASGGFLDEVDCLEQVALRHPVHERDSGRHLVSFVLRLALDAGLDIEDSDLDQWAQTLVSVVTLNDLRDSLRMQGASAELRLLISLHGSPTGGWPEEVVAWLLQGPGFVESIASKKIDCRPIQAEVERALGEAVEWAADLVEDPSALIRRIDIALPAMLLLGWRPEEVEVPTKLGVHHDVVLRWSGLLNPPSYLCWALREVAARLGQIAVDEHDAPLDWLAPEVTADRDELDRRLRDGAYAGGLGLRFSPNGQHDLLELLLAFSPILVWPDGTSSVESSLEQEVQKRWMSLPAGFCHAYRQRWGAASDQAAPSLACLRAVWDDGDWVKLCWKFRRRLKIQTKGRL